MNIKLFFKIYVWYNILKKLPTVYANKFPFI